jgi:hypothetical protein
MLVTAFTSALLLLLPVAAWKLTRSWRRNAAAARGLTIVVDLLAVVAIPNILVTAMGVIGSVRDDVRDVFGIVLVDRRVAIGIAVVTLLLVIFQVRTSRDRIITLDLTR